MRAQQATASDVEFSLVRDDAPMRLQRALKLAPAGGLGTGRRAVFFALFTWLPIAAWALATAHALPGGDGESLLIHFGIHTLCLVAIPLLIVSEAVANVVAHRVVPQFLTSGVVAEADRPRFVAIVRDVARMRDASLPWVLVLGVVIATTLLGDDAHSDSVAWARESSGLGFGGWWFLYVARPIYTALVLGWVWRLALIALLFTRIAKLDLSFVPTHPDSAAGIGFVESLPSGFALWVFAVSSVAASRWAHEVLYHGADVSAYRLPLVALTVVLVLLVLAPLLAFAPRLARARRLAIRDYAELVGEHGRLVRRRWILHETLENDDVLHASELGPIADTTSLYQGVERMRALPFGRRALAMVLVPIAVPMAIAASTQIPIKDLLLKVAKALM